MPTLSLTTSDPDLFSGQPQQATIENSWSRGLLSLVYLTPSGITAIVVHPWIANSGQKAMDDVAKYVKKYDAEMLIVGKLEMMK